MHSTEQFVMSKVQPPVSPPSAIRRERRRTMRDECSASTQQEQPLSALHLLSKRPSFRDRVQDVFHGDEGAGLAISFVVHAVILCLLAIPVVNSLQPEPGLTTLVQNATHEDDVIFDAPLDTLMAMPEAQSSETKFETKLFEPASQKTAFIPQLSVDLNTSIEGQQNGSGNNGEFGGGRTAEPENAVKVGNFSVWCWPILASGIDGKTVHGTPGEFPKVRQDYSIVIRIKVPDYKTYARISDFSGRVVGTDGYTQRIPDDAYFFRLNGDLIKARPSYKIPVVDGTVEILIRVPGASFAEVRDTIRVYSRILDEEQEIELVFQSRE